MKNSKQKIDSGLGQSLGEVIKRLTSQPLLFSIAILLVLAIVASLAIDAMNKLLWPALFIFVVGLLIWLAVELPKVRASAATGFTSSRVKVTARDVGNEGSVVGIEGLPQKKDAPDEIEVEGKKVDGRVAGVRFNGDKQE